MVYRLGSRSAEGSLVLVLRRLAALDFLLHIPCLLVQALDFTRCDGDGCRHAVRVQSDGDEALNGCPLLDRVLCSEGAVQVPVLLRETAHEPRLTMLREGSRSCLA